MASITINIPDTLVTNPDNPIEQIALPLLVAQSVADRFPRIQKANTGEWIERVSVDSEGNETVNFTLAQWAVEVVKNHFFGKLVENKIMEWKKKEASASATIPSMEA